MNIQTLQTISLNNNAETIELSRNGIGDSVASVVYLQVMSNATIALTGTTEKGKTATAIGAIDMKDFSKKTSITAAGIYMVNADALFSLTITATGSTDVIVKAVK